MMDIEQVKRRTWVIYASGMCIPFYRVKEREWILLDCGMAKMEQELFELLEREKIHIVAVLVSHLHYDHVGNIRALKERSGAKIIMSAYDAGTAQNPLTLKGLFYSSTVPEIEACYQGMCCQADELILPDQKDIVVQGIRFELLSLPGHAASQIGIVTPDRVAYLADSLFSGTMLQKDTIIYHMHWEQALKTLQALKSFVYPFYILAHNGVFFNLERVIRENEAYNHKLFEKFCSICPEEFTLEELVQDSMTAFGISTRNGVKARILERSIRSILEYLLECGEVKIKVKNGVIFYLKEVRGGGTE